MSDKPTGVFVRLPLSAGAVDQYLRASHSGEPLEAEESALEAGLLAIGTPVTGGDMSVVDYSEYEPKYHDQGMGCGLEDRGIQDRYEAMAYGWDQAMERVCSEFPETVLLSDHQAQIAALEAEVKEEQRISNLRADAVDAWTNSCAQQDQRIAELEEELSGFRAGLSELIAKEVAALKGGAA